MVVGWGQCIEDEEVELWDVCYNIAETDSLDLEFNQLSGSIPSAIGQLTKLEALNS